MRWRCWCAGAAGVSDVTIRETFQCVLRHRNHVVHTGAGHGYEALLTALRWLGATPDAFAAAQAEVKRTLAGIEKLHAEFKRQVRTGGGGHVLTGGAMWAAVPLQIR
jgi:hypothetical protein